VSKKGDYIAHFWLYDRLAGQSLYSVRKIVKTPLKNLFLKKLIDDTNMFNKIDLAI